ncbi:MAG: DMT family transporter [Anaerolineales bacterium]|nr:DMT family transporter [Anaerolineales bacterium]
MTTQAILYILITGFFFGTSLVASRFAVGQFEPIVYVGLRLLVSSLSFLLVYSVAGRRYAWPKGWHIWRHAIVLGLSSAIAMTGFTSALRYLSSGLTSIISTAGPALTVIMAHYALADERLTWRKIAGVALALGGALLLILRGESGLTEVTQVSGWGYGLLLFAMLVIAGNTIYIRRYTQEFEPFQLTSIQVFAACLLVAPLSLWLVGIDWSGVNWQGIGALLYAGIIGTFLSFILFLHIAQEFGATAAAMTNYINPVFATLAGVLLLGETLTVGMGIGVAIIMMGVWLTNRHSRRRVPKIV